MALPNWLAVQQRLAYGTGSTGNGLGQRLTGLGLGSMGRILGRAGPGHVPPRQAATWHSWAPTRLGLHVRLMVV